MAPGDRYRLFPVVNTNAGCLIRKGIGSCIQGVWKEIQGREAPFLAAYGFYLFEELFGVHRRRLGMCHGLLYAASSCLVIDAHALKACRACMALALCARKIEIEYIEAKKKGSTQEQRQEYDLL